MITYEHFLKEGVYDPNIFKAVFMAGGPGSGKSFIAGRTTGGLGLKIINSDNAFERILKKEGLSLKMPGPETVEKDWNVPRAKAKRVTVKKQDAAVIGRLGLLIDGTGHEYDKVATRAAKLNQLGYETSMIFVNTSLEVALERNQKRPRSVQPSIAKKSWQDVQNNMGKYQSFFGPANFFIVDNNGVEQDLLHISAKHIRRAIVKPVKNVIALAWIENEMKKKRRT